MHKNIIFHYIIIILAALPAALPAQRATRGKPNVILICAGDMGRGLISANGQKHFSTPNIDYLFNSGVSFGNAHGGAQTAPARASLLTGYSDCRKDRWRVSKGGVYIKEDTAYIRQNEEYIDGNDVLLPDGDLYLPQVFRHAGYVTAQTGLLGAGNTATRRQMDAFGWDYYYGYLDHVMAEGFYPPFLFEAGRPVMLEGNTHLDGGRTREPENESARDARWNMTGKAVYAPDLILNKTLDFIDYFKDRAFFLMFCPQLPRGPVSIPEIDPEVAGNDRLSQIEKEYASMVRLLDRQTGAILAELQMLGLEENTMIIFTSDCGHEIYYTQEGGLNRPCRNLKTGEFFDNSYLKYYSHLAGDVFDGNGGLAGLKRSNLEGGVRVPLVFCQKDRLKKYENSAVVAGYDFIATMADMLGVRLETKKDGVSLYPLLLGRKKLPKQRHIVYASDEGPALITNDGWKLRYFKPGGRYELYNLQRDPQEKYDVILRFPEKADAMAKILLKECNGNIDNGIFY